MTPAASLRRRLVAASVVIVLLLKAVHDIVANLFDNARRRAASKVEVTVRPAGKRIEVRVADDGPGLLAEAAERVFERSFSLDPRNGSGLGLPIAQELARAHGGAVRYDDDAFVVTLPWLPDQRDATAEATIMGWVPLGPAFWLSPVATQPIGDNVPRSCRNSLCGARREW